LFVFVVVFLVVVANVVWESNLKMQLNSQELSELWEQEMYEYPQGAVGKRFLCAASKMPGELTASVALYSPRCPPSTFLNPPYSMWLNVCLLDADNRHIHLYVVKICFDVFFMYRPSQPTQTEPNRTELSCVVKIGEEWSGVESRRAPLLGAAVDAWSIFVWVDNN